MKIIDFGSINIDNVYSVNSAVKEGEIIFAPDPAVFIGGKGLNQALAASHAGASVLLAGAIGPDGTFIEEYLKTNNVDTSHLMHVSTGTGHTVIQVSKTGQNSIISCLGANNLLSEKYIDSILNLAQSDDVILLQNEISNVRYIIEKAHSKGLFVAWNPSPLSDEISRCNAKYVNLFFLNQIEGAALSGCKPECSGETILNRLISLFPDSVIVLTLGSNGCVCYSNGHTLYQPVFNVPIVDTTGAGDTFTGYFLSEMCRGSELTHCLKKASAAAALVVSRNGAAQSIPDASEVDEFMR